MTLTQRLTHLARLTTFAALTFALIVGFTSIVTAALADWMIVSDARLIPVTATLILPALVATALCARFLDRAPIRDFGLGGGWRDAASELGVGAVGGVLLVVCALTLVGTGGQVSISAQRFDPLGLLFYAASFLVAASWEELVFRGYGFVHLCRGVGKIAATLLVSGFFALVHLANPNADPIAMVNIALAGIMFALAFFRTDGRLWLPIGLHWGWNAAGALMFGIPVSGLDAADVPGLATVVLRGPEWLTGGPFGLEGSVASTAILTLACVGLWKWPGRAPQAPPPAPGDGEATSTASPEPLSSPDAPRSAP